MNFTLRARKGQGGAALLVLLAVIALGASWFLVSRLDALAASFINRDRNLNAEVLNKAKQALIGYVTAQANKEFENDPGRLPCPEAAGLIGDPTEGTTAGSCTLPAVGRFPWRSIGTEKLLDANGEPLWYVVSPGWAYTSSNLTINADTAGQLLVDPKTVSQITRSGTTATVTSIAHGFKTGDSVKIASASPAGYSIAATITVLSADQFTYTVDSTLSTPATGAAIRAGIAAVALIIAPGRPISVQASADCTARDQARATPSPTINPLDYLECYNATTAAFSTAGPSTSFNDQAVKVTAADVMPGIEAAIANRIEREIVPLLQTVFAPATWGFAGSNPVYPHAAPFANPGPGSGTSDYRGVAGTTQGLLPFNRTQGCTESASDPRCTTATTGGTAFLVFSKSGADSQIGGSGSIRTQSSCAWQSTTYVCTGEYNQPTVSVRASVNVTNVAMGLRALDLTKVTCSAKDDAGGGIGTQNVPCTATIALQSSGAAIVTVTTSAMPDVVGSGWGTYANYLINIERAAIGDHVLLSSTDATTGWFVRNEWYRLLHYAVASGHTASSLPAGPAACTAAPPCLALANVSPADPRRALLILAGRSINGSLRPSATLADYLELGNASGAYERQLVSRKSAFNDRVIIVKSN